MASLRDYVAKIKLKFDGKGFKEFEEATERAKTKFERMSQGMRDHTTRMKQDFQESKEKVTEFGDAGDKALKKLGGAVQGFIGLQLARYIKNITSAWNDNLISMNQVAKSTEIQIARVNELRKSLRGTSIDMSDVRDFTFSIGETMADAANGASTFQQAYETLGITLNEWGGASAEQRLEVVLVKLQELKDESIATAQFVGAQIFGEDVARKILGNIDELVEGVQKKLEPLASIKLALDAEQAENARAQAEAWAETAGQSVGNTFGTHFWLSLIHI